MVKARLEEYLRAEQAILQGAQSYQIGSRSLTRANLSEIRAAIAELSAELKATEGVVYGKARRVVFID